MQTGLLQRKPAPDARVLKTRDYEDKLYSMQQGVQVNISASPLPACKVCLECLFLMSAVWLSALSIKIVFVYLESLAPLAHSH